MRAELKRISSPDCEDLTTYYPEDIQNFSVLLQVFVGEEGKTVEESFDVELCTPKYLMDNYSKEEIIIGRRQIIVFDYNFTLLENRLKKYCQSCTGKTWEEIACKLMRMGRWEFEDYQE